MVHIKYEVCTVHRTELIFVMPKNLSVLSQDIFAERADTYLLIRVRKRLLRPLDRQ